MENLLPLPRMLADFRRRIGKSQSQFAAMLGVSKHTIISLENSRNRLSPELAKLIRAATGLCVVSPKEKNYGDFGHNQHITRYTREDFDRWRDKFKSDDQSAQERYDALKHWLLLVFKAASKPGVAGNRDRLPAVYLSLVNWLEQTRTTFKLETETDHLLEDATRHIVKDHFLLEDLRKQKDAADKLANYLGIKHKDLFKGFKTVKAQRGDICIFVELEVRCVWDPAADESDIEIVLCKKKKLSPHPKYWFGEIPQPWEDDDL
jgi:transcriptional regulator with XRE-family HTH domain